MAEKPSRGAGGDSLATMNDHLARFFRNADDLLHEWQGFGDKLRASLDAEVQGLSGTVSEAVSRAGQAAAQRLDGELERGMAESLAGLRREIETLTRMANQAGARMQGGRAPGGHPAAERGARGERRATTAGGRLVATSWANPLVWALTTANLMLAVLVVLGVRECRSSGSEAVGPGAPGIMAGTPAQAADAGPPADAQPSPPEGLVVPAEVWPEDRARTVCTALAGGYDAAAAKALIEASAQALCSGVSLDEAGGPIAPDVARSVITRLEAAAAKAGGGPGQKKKKTPEKDKKMSR